MLSLSLARDAGPRESTIRLLPEGLRNEYPGISEEERIPHNGLISESDSPSIVGPLHRKVSKQFSRSFAQRVPDARPESSPRAVSLSVPFTRTLSLTGRADGSAYGISGSYRRQYYWRNPSMTFGNKADESVASFDVALEGN